MFDEKNFVHFIPVLSTVISLAFLIVLLNHYFKGGKKPYVGWWAAGVFTYGLGTGLESAVTLMGNSVLLTKSWYVAGAILGGWPLAQGSVYLHLKRKTANILSAITIPVIIITGILVFSSPANEEKLLDFVPSGDILEWQWVRLITPFINIYAAIFLIGGAFYSAYKYYQSRTHFNRVIGNNLIAIGAILPGIGGTLAKGGYVEALYIGEFAGIILIWLGYKFCISDKIRKADLEDDKSLEGVS
jgi:hypothetical protein